MKRLSNIILIKPLQQNSYINIYVALFCIILYCMYLLIYCLNTNLNYPLK